MSVYISPIWANGTTPPISAANLQSLSNALQVSQTIIGTAAPTASDFGYVGNMWFFNGKRWQCVAASGGAYTWQEFGTGGGIQIPERYQTLFDAAETLYGGSYANVFIAEETNYVTVGFMLDTWSLTGYTSSTTAFTATGWYACVYNKTSGGWTEQDYRTTANADNAFYLTNWQYCSTTIIWQTAQLYPLGPTPGSGNVQYVAVSCSPYYTVTLTLGSHVLTGSYTLDQTNITFAMPTFGIWSGTVTDQNSTVVSSFTLSVYPQNLTANAYPVEKRTLANDTWAEISANSVGGQAFMYYNLGDTKTVALTDSTSVVARIIGFNHDSKSGGGTAGISFDLQNCLNTKYNMNASDTNTGGWNESAMRARMLPGGAIYSLIPSDLMSVIVPVLKMSGVGGGTTGGTTTTTDYLWLLSEIEIFNALSYSVAGEGFVYDYYKNYANTNSKRIKTVAGSASYWWGRSPYSGNTYYFCGVGSGGSADYSDASNARGVSFGFCV